jgi:acetyl/propionyl-CoA carboxylase alpha subunit/acetyl-CoA carboxylase carboxyltransferase component
MLSDDTRIAILDHGLGAVRLIEVVRELNRQRGSRLSTVALHPDSDRDSRSVREADEAIPLGSGRPRAAEIESALRLSRAGAIWTGSSSVEDEIEGVLRRLRLHRIGRQSTAPDTAQRAEEMGLTVSTLEDLRGLRLIDVPLVADGAGNAWALGVVDRTIAVVSESPSPVLAPWDAESLLAVVQRVARSANVRGVCTASFAFRTGGEAVSLTGWHTGLRTGHEVVEATTGVDLVKLQLELDLGDKLDGDGPATTGHALGVRIEASDPDLDFTPRPGPVELLRLPAGSGIRIDVGAREGDVVSSSTAASPSVAAVTAWGQDREEARARLARALLDTAAIVAGGTTTRPFLISILERDEMRGSHYDASWLDDLVARSEHVSTRLGDIALIQAAIDAHDAASDVEQGGFYASALRGRPRLAPEMGRAVELRHRGQLYRLKVYRTGLRDYQLVESGRAIDAHLDRLGKFESVLRCFGRRHRIVALVEGRDHLVEVDGTLHRVSRDDLGIVRSTTPAVVVSIPVAAGDVIEKGRPVAVVEAMKMEMSIGAPFTGRVRSVLANPNTQVPAGAPLVRLDPIEASEDSDPAPIGSVARDEGPARESEAPSTRSMRTLDAMRRVLLGYDADPDEVARLVPVWDESSRGWIGDRTKLQAAEDEILQVFSDVCALSRGQPLSDDDTGEQTRSPQEDLLAYVRSLDAASPSLSAGFVRNLSLALGHYGLRDLRRTLDLERAVFRIFKSLQRLPAHVEFVTAILNSRVERLADAPVPADGSFRDLLDRLIWATQRKFPAITDAARETRYRYFDQPLFEATRDRIYSEVEAELTRLVADPHGADRDSVVASLVGCPQPLKRRLTRLYLDADEELRRVMLEILALRYYRIRGIRDVSVKEIDGGSVLTAFYDHEDARIRVTASFARLSELERGVARVERTLADVAEQEEVVVDFYVWRDEPPTGADETALRCRRALDAVHEHRHVRRMVVAISGSGAGTGLGATEHFTFRRGDDGFLEDRMYRGLHPMMAKRLGIRRLAAFDVDRLLSAEDVYLFHAVARENRRDERLFAIAEVRDLTAVRDPDGRLLEIPHLERMVTESLEAIRRYQSRRPPGSRLYWNRVLLYVWPRIDLPLEEVLQVVHRLAPATEGLGLEEVEVRLKVPNPKTGRERDMELHISNPAGKGLSLSFDAARDDPVEPLSEYEHKVKRMRQRGLTYPYEIVKMLTPSADAVSSAFPAGDFSEYDLDGNGRLVAVDRPYGENQANVIVGVIRNYTPAVPEGMTRVVLLGDPSRALGSLAEPECRRIIAALDLAEEMGIPLEWFAVSAGAKISMDSGTENMDWIGAVLKRLIEFTQAGGEVNVVVCGINVGAQPYWNAEATMLMHTSGILIMTADGAMVLTGKQALDFSGGVSADDNFGIGGYERIMGPNGQAQYWAGSIDDACSILLRHYDHTYVVPGERVPRRVETSDPYERDVRRYEHRADEGTDFRTVGDVFSEQANPGRKKPFDIRSVMRSVIDQDHAPLERWAGMRDAEIAVVWDAHVGGFPVCLMGIESKPVARKGLVPADGPERWTSGTLFPIASKKVARAINAASGNRPLVVMANLSGFDGSPESMRGLQLEYGAEIGRAVVNFDGPIVFCVISRYHGGAFVVFSAALNVGLEVAALEGSYASVIGGAPAAAAVFARAVDARTKEDPRVVAIQERMAEATGAERAHLQTELDEVTRAVRSEKLGEAAREFDSVHTIQRAQSVGSVHTIIPPARLRPYVIDAVDRGICRVLESG